jgi:mono/diheme cytochrome c family protein
MFSRRTDAGAAIVVFDPAAPSDPPRVIFETEKGFVWDLCPSWDGTRLLFSYKENGDLPFHVWEIGVDGSGLRQVTSGPWHDFNPVYGPGGLIVFCSSRVESYSLCQNFLASALYTCEADGGDLRRIDFTTLCTSAPSVLPDGRILCTRWEYQDKNIFSWQGLWTIGADGRQLRLFFGNTLTVPNSLYGGKPVPGSDRVMFTMAAHHHPPIGDVAVVDRRGRFEDPAAVTKATFETPYVPTVGRTWRDTNWGPGDRFYPQAAVDPWPVDGERFLVSVGAAARGAGAPFRLCVAFTNGVRVPLLQAADAGHFAAVPLAPRPSPPSAAARAPQEPGEGTYFVEDVYRGLEEQGVQRGQVAALRVVRVTPKKWNTEGPRFHDHYPIVGYGSYYVKENLGEVPVRADGSAFFRVPSNCELYFIALDASGKEVCRMGSVTQITTGERASCVGCHEPRDGAAPVGAARAGPRAAREPDAIRPPPWGAGPFDYVRHVQPVWDRHCVRCHSGRTPAAGVDLSGDATRFFNMSYDHLVRRGMVEHYFINPGPTGVFPPLESGSWVSRLTKLIEERHHDVDLDDESRRRVWAWIDSNIQYYGTWDMSRPYTTGGRDPWFRVVGEGRGPLEPEPWFAGLTALFRRHCAGCHGAGERRDHPADMNRWVNLTRPENSRLLNAHLSADAGGMGLTKPKRGQVPPVFASTNDPVWRALHDSIAAGRDALDARPRMDMPGGVPVPQVRDFGRVF